MADKHTDEGHTVGIDVAFALYSAAIKMTRLHKSFLDKLGLTFPQYLVMLELFARTPRSVGELGAKLGMDTGTITPLLKRLEVAGLVTRTRDSKDERRVLIDLTSAANAIEQDVRAVSSKVTAVCDVSHDGLAGLRDHLAAFVAPAEPTSTIIDRRPLQSTASCGAPSSTEPRKA